MVLVDRHDRWQMTTIHVFPGKRKKQKNELVKLAYRCSKFDAYDFLSCLRAKFDDDDFNSVRGIVFKGDRQTDRQPRLHYFFQSRLKSKHKSEDNPRDLFIAPKWVTPTDLKITG